MNADAQLMEHMMNPKNYGEMENSDAIGMGKNPLNGEKVAIYLKVKRDRDKLIIEDISFQAISCTTTIVAGSIITTEARGITFTRVEKSWLSTIPNRNFTWVKFIGLIYSYLQSVTSDSPCRR